MRLLLVFFFFNFLYSRLRAIYSVSRRAQHVSDRRDPSIYKIDTIYNILYWYSQKRECKCAKMHHESFIINIHGSISPTNIFATYICGVFFCVCIIDKCFSIFLYDPHRIDWKFIRNIERVRKKTGYLC